MATRTTVITPFARLSYPQLFTARENDQGKKIFNCVLLFPKDIQAAGARLGLSPKLIADATAAMQTLKQLCGQTALDYYGGKEKIPQGILRQDLGKQSGWPFRDQGEKPSEGYVPGALMISPSTTTKPKIVDRNMQPIVEEQHLYAGCWVRASVTCFGYRNKGNTGISFGLNNVQKVCDDEPLAGRSRPDDDFEAIEGAEGAAASGESAESLFS